MSYLMSILMLMAGTALAGPRLECTASAYDFGVVASTAVVTHVFVLANVGDEPLRIDWTRVCCGSTAEVATNRVPAGTNTTLRVTLAMAGKQGQVEKAVYVMSNDPVTPVFRLSIMATVPATGTFGGHK